MSDPKGTRHSTRKHVFWTTKLCLSGWAVHVAFEELKAYAMNDSFSRAPRHAPFWLPSSFLFGRVANVTNRAEFELNWFNGFGTPRAEKRPSSLTSCVALTYNGVNTNVLHCEARCRDFNRHASSRQKLLGRAARPLVGLCGPQLSLAGPVLSPIAPLKH